MKKGTRVFALTMTLTLLFWTLLPTAGVFALNKPAITVATPANNLVTDVPYIDIQGYVTEQATVEIDNVRVSTSPNGYFSYRKQPLTNGINTILITAVNSAGSDSKYLTVIYDPAAVSPTIVVTSHTDGQTVGTATVNLTCSVNNNTSLTYTVYGTGPTVGPITVPGAVNGTYPIPNVPLNPGDNTIVLTAANGTRVVNQPIHLIYSGGGPEITNISPNGVKVSTDKVVFTGIVKNASGGLKMYVNGAATGTPVSFDSAGNFQTGEVTLSPGDNSIRFEATGTGTTANQTVTVRYEASPTIVITSPKNNDIVTWDSVVISGKVFNTETNGLTVNDEKVSFYSDGSFSKTINLDKIVNHIRIRAANGSLVNTADLTIYFSGIPRIEVDHPISGDTVNTADVVFEGSIFPTDNIKEFTIEGATGGPKDNRGTISGNTFSSLPVPLDPTSSTDVIFTLSTEGVTTANGVYLPPRTVKRTIKLNSNVGPVITISSPVDGSTVYSNNVTIRGKLQRADFNSLKVDGIPTEVNSDGTFSQTVTLTSGKKDIKIEAKLVGDEDKTTTKTITVYYDSIAAESAVVRTKMTDGGEAKAFNDMVKVKLTKGTVWMNTISVLTMADPDDFENIPSQSALVGPVVSVGWNGEKPLQTYKVTLKYDDVVRENQAHKVSVLYYDDSNEQWIVLGGTVDSKAKTVSVQTNKSGCFAAALYFKTFDDVTNHWGQRDIEYLVARGAIPLNTTYLFHPDLAITRAEFVMFLVKAMGLQRYHPSRESYDDLDHDSDYYEYIEAALRAGLVVGISHDKFAPNQNITREEAAIVLARAGNLKALKEPDIIKILGKFTDEKSISPWARNQLAAAVKAKVLNGSADNNFNPRGKTTRAQAAAMIVRLTEVLYKTLK